MTLPYPGIYIISRKKRTNVHICYESSWKRNFLHFQFLESKHFERFAKNTPIKYKVVKETIMTMADKIVHEAKETTEEFSDLYGKNLVLKEINDVITNSSKQKLMVFSKK